MRADESNSSNYQLPLFALSVQNNGALSTVPFTATARLLQSVVLKKKRNTRKTSSIERVGGLQETQKGTPPNPARHKKRTPGISCPVLTLCSLGATWNSPHVTAPFFFPWSRSSSPLSFSCKANTPSWRRWRPSTSHPSPLACFLPLSPCSSLPETPPPPYSPGRNAIQGK